MFETTLQVFNVQISEVTEGDESVTVGWVTGIPTPFGGPDGNPVILMGGIYRAAFNKQAAQEMIKGLQEQVDKLPDPRPQSNIVVPGSMEDVERVARAQERFTR